MTDFLERMTQTSPVSSHNLLDALDNEWAQWLWQRDTRPGVVRLPQVYTMSARLTHLANPPLADAVARRYAAIMALQQQALPVVYAQPVSPAQSNQAQTTAKSKTVQLLPTVTAQPLIVTTHVLPTPTTADSPPLPLVTTHMLPTPTTADSLPQPAVSRSSLSSAQINGRTAHPTSPKSPVKRSAAGPSSGIASVAASLPLPVVRPQPAAPQPTRLTRLPATRDDRSKRDTPGPSLPVSPVAAMEQVAFALPPMAADLLTPGNHRPGSGVWSRPGASEQLPKVTPLSPPPPGIRRPLPLSQRSGDKSQHAMQDTAVHQPAASPQVTPAPNRVIQTNHVVQRTAAAMRTNTAVIQRQNEAEAGSEAAESTPQKIDMDELVNKVHRRFLRQLAVEGERRGKTSWL